MIDLNQIIHIKWTTRNKKYYEDLGYEYTGMLTPLDVVLKDVPTNSSEHVIAVCDICGKPVSVPYRNYNKLIGKNNIYRCGECATRKASTEDRLNKNATEKYQTFLDCCKEKGYTPVTTFEQYNGIKTEMYYICPKHGLQHTQMSRFQNGAGCIKCAHDNVGNLFRKTIDEVIADVESKNNNKLINPNDYIDCGVKNMRILCGSCGNEFVTSINNYNHMQKCKCPECTKKDIGNANRTKIEHIIDLCTIGDELKLLNPEDFVDWGKRNLKFKCIQCGETFVSSLANYVYRQKRCSFCSGSISDAEYIVRKFLDTNDINYIPEKRFPDCRDQKSLPFDFYIPQLNLIIETDGGQHFSPRHRGIENFKKTKKHDRIKNWYCIKNGIRLVRIPFWDFNKINYILQEILLNDSEEMYLKYSII